MRTLAIAAVVLPVLIAPVAAVAQTTKEIETLRAEVETLKKDYAARIEALEGRLRAAEAATQRPAQTDAQAVPGTAARVSEAGPAPSQAPVATASSGAPATASSPASATTSGPAPANSFNPSIALILSGAYTSTTQDPASYAITGFALPSDAEIGPGRRGFSLGESELSFAASIDPWLRGAANLSLEADNSVSLEEAFVQTTALGNGLTAKAGRFYSGIGYLNSQHKHAWDFADSPLAYQAMLGTQYGDDGVQVQWLAPTDLYIALGAELGRGRTFPGSDKNNNGAGMTAVYAHAGGDVGESHTWRAGLSLLNAKADNQALVFGAGTNAATDGTFSGTTGVWVADFVWKWAPEGNATRTSLKVQGEYLRSRRDGNLLLDPAAGPGSYVVTQSGWYLQGVYQFLPRWRVGLRTDRLDPGTPQFASTDALTATSYRPSRNTVMLDFNPSEFSRVRLQYARDKAREGVTDNEVTLQYQMSLGAHGAHNY